jgi:hypothetical protein
LLTLANTFTADTAQVMELELVVVNDIIGACALICNTLKIVKIISSDFFMIFC